MMETAIPNAIYGCMLRKWTLNLTNSLMLFLKEPQVEKTKYFLKCLGMPSQRNLSVRKDTGAAAI